MLPDHPIDALPETQMSRAIDRFVRSVGHAVSGVWVLLLLAIVANVTLRYVFGAGRVEFEELQWHLYALGFLAGLSYGVQADAHIRVDVVSERLSPRTRAWIDLYGTLLLLLPFVALIVVYGVPFAWHAWESGEISPSPGGLPYRWIIKASLPLGFALLGLATCARIARVSSLLFGRARPSPEGAAREPGA